MPEPTQFAPAQRTDTDILIKQIELFENDLVASAMLNTTPDVFMVLNENRQIIYANDALTELIGQPDRQVIYGQRVGEALSCAHADESTGGCGTTEFCSKCGAVQAMLTALKGLNDVQECRISLKSGDALDLRVWAKPIHVKDQKFVMFAAQDITHEKRRQIMERIFFHDILNTAGLIMGVMELYDLRTEIGQTFDLNQYRELLTVASHRLVDEVEAQRLISSAEAHTLKLQQTKFDVQTFLTQIIETMRQIYHKKGIQVELKEGAKVIMDSDTTLLGRVIVNLIKNAVEASEEGDTVTVAYVADRQNIKFSVHNSTYMPRDVQLQIFKRSFSTKGDGRGLGTYSIKLLTEQYLSGTVWFETNKPYGTTFFVAYPLH